MRLPTVDAPRSPCFGCFTPCCRSYEVPLTGFDLWRLVRGLDVSWHAVAEARRDFSRDAAAFRLDRSAHLYSLWLRRREGSCTLLVELPGEQARCGAHAVRPLACRLYPLDRRAEGRIELVPHALCPPGPRQAHADDRAQAAGRIGEELDERALYEHLIARWNRVAAELPRAQPLDVDELVRWMLDVYDRLLPLRSLATGALWAPAARAFLDAVPPPSLEGAGY